MLGPLDRESIRVLDLYAGSGSLGIEALSRGAGWADFVERHPLQCEAIRRNLTDTGLSQLAQVHCMDVMKALSVLTGSYSLVLMDPPYALTSLDEVLGDMAETLTLEDGATVVVGHSKRLELKDGYGRFTRSRSYRYGDSAVDFFAVDFSKGGDA